MPCLAGQLDTGDDDLQDALRATAGPTVGVVGCGYWGRNLVRNFAALGALGAVCDVNPVAADAMAERYDTAAMSLAEILQRPDIGAVAIAAPAAEHSTLGEAALRAGKHVFIEKPLALDMEQALALCRLSESSGLVLMVGHLMQYHPAFVELLRMVRGGDLGVVRYLYSNRLNLGKIRREENALWSFAPHDISMILSIVDARPELVSAVGGNYLNAAVADVTMTNLSFAGGQQAHIFVSWLHPFKEQRLVVVGDRAMALFDDGEPWERKLLLYRHEVDWEGVDLTAMKADAEPVVLTPSEPLEDECRHFLECISEGKTPRTDGREGLRVLEVLQQAQHSLAGWPRRGRSREVSVR